MKIKQNVYDWCIKNNRIDILNRWDYDLNTIDPHDTSIYSKDYFYLKCPNSLHKSSQYQIASLGKHNSLLECKYCLSFGHWCIINNRQDLLDRWDYDLNNTIPEETAKTSPNKYFFKCPRNIHPSTSYKLSNLTKYTYGEAQCKCCNSFAQWGTDNIDENFLDLYWDYEKNIDINPWETPFRARPNTVIYMKCQYDENHSSYKTFPDHFVEGARCPKCTFAKTESYLQETVRKYLENKYQYNLTHEYECSIVAYNNESKHYMPYDNDIQIAPYVHLIIEVHGKQHYEITQYTKLYAKRSNISELEALFRQQQRDKIKKEYVLSHNGYYYLELSYQVIKDGSFTSIIDNKIQEILSTIQN